MSQYKAIFCDLDGTLLTKQEKFPHPDFIQWIPVLKQLNINFILITGRLIEEAQLIYQKIGLDPELTPYIIACNGAQIYDTKSDQLLQNLELNPEIVTKILAKIPALIQKFPYLQSFLFTSNGVIRAYPELTKIQKLLENQPPGASDQFDNIFQPSFLHGRKIIPQQITQLSPDSGQKMNKAVFTMYRGDFYQLQKFCYQNFNIPGIDIVFSSAHSIELSNVCCTKGLALQKVVELLDIPLKTVLALGDAGNDISMLNLPEITSVCATWSQPAVQAVAKYHFSGQPGFWVLNAFEQLIVKNDEKSLK